MGKQKRIPRIPKQFKKILKGRGRGKGEGLTITVGLTKGQGLAKTDPNISLKGISKNIPKGKKVRKTIIKTASQGTKIGGDTMMTQKEKQRRLKEEGRMQGLSTTVGAAKKRNMKTFRDKKTGVEKAAVTREDLTKVGLDPSKKSSLTKYLNMRNKTGKTPTKSDFAPKSNLLGDAMKKQDTKRIQKNIKAGRKKDISSARKADPNDPSYNVKKLKPSERDSKKLITTKSAQSGIPKTTPKRKVTSSYNRKPNPNDPFTNPYRSMAKGGFIKTGDGDKIVKRAYGGKVGK
jgi:hypothetical protein|tara:strand:- start:181 stop:1050 length:870 start_codon:yes stop_codon:yes gene_type:complete